MSPQILAVSSSHVKSWILMGDAPCPICWQHPRDCVGRALCACCLLPGAPSNSQLPSTSNQLLTLVFADFLSPTPKTEISSTQPPSHISRPISCSHPSLTTPTTSNHTEIEIGLSSPFVLPHRTLFRHRRLRRRISPPPQPTQSCTCLALQPAVHHLRLFPSKSHRLDKHVDLLVESVHGLRDPSPQVGSPHSLLS